MGIKLDRLMEALGLDTEWTEEDRTEIKERREKLNQPLDHIIDDIRARKVLKRIKELVEFVDSLKFMGWPYVSNGVEQSPPRYRIYVDNTTDDVTVRKGQIVVDNRSEDDYKYGNGVMDMLQ